MTSQITHWIAVHGLIAVFVLMALDAVVPAGGEIVMLFAGALAAGAIAGHAGPSLPAVIATGTLGYLAGSLAGWGIGRAGGRAFIERRGRWLHIGMERFVRAERWFGRFGAAFVFAGRLLPLVRSFVSVPAGVLEYPLARYTALTAAASLIWCVAFATAGHALGASWDGVDHTFRYAASHLDAAAYRAIDGLDGNPVADAVLTFLTAALPVVMVAIVALAFLLPSGRRRAERRRGAVLATASAALALLAVQPLAHLVDRARPYLAHPAHAHLLIARSHDPSFPSDHATGAFALAVAVFVYDRTIGTVLLALAALLAFTRVYVGTHYPGDVLAGALIGGGVALALHALPFTRAVVEELAARCGALWDSALTRLLPRRLA